MTWFQRSGADISQLAAARWDRFGPQISKGVRPLNTLYRGQHALFFLPKNLKIN